MPSPTTQIQEAYDLFRLEKRGSLISPRTMEFYEKHLGEWFRWMASEAPNVGRFSELDITVLREYRAHLLDRRTPKGLPLQPETMACSHRSIRVFLNWAENEGHEIDRRMLRLKGPRLPQKEATLFHLKQIRAILAACDNPTEDLAVRILVGSGVRRSELVGLCLKGPDGMSDLMTDSIDRGRAELRVRADGGAKGLRGRRVPVTLRLAAAIKRYTASHRPNVNYPEILIGGRNRPFRSDGFAMVMNRLQRRVGFRIYAHAFRHTFATVTTQAGWNMEKLRAALGHSDYSTLMRYNRMSSERDLGRISDWAEYIVVS